MRLRALWLSLGSAALTVACGLSVGGLAPEPGVNGEPGPDATSGEGSAPGADGASDAQPGQGDAAMHHDGAGGDASGRPDGRSDAGDAAVDAELDSGVDDAADADAGPPPPDGGPAEAGCVDGSAGCVIVPPGWTLVAFAPNLTAACPSGFQSPTNLVEGPAAGSGACACGTCNVTGQPSCASGAVPVYYDVAAGPGGPTCNLPSATGSLRNSPPGSCGEPDSGANDHFVGNYGLYDIEYVPPAPSGGACSAPGAATGSGITYSAHDRACVPISPQSAGCAGDACMPGLTAPYAACIMQSGSLPCPAGPLSVEHTVGSGVTFGCTDCGCTVSGQCTGTVTLYTDGKCMNAGLTVPADGSCYSVTSLAQGGGTNFRSYTYAGGIPGAVQCSATGTSSAQSVALANLATICCAP